MNVKAVIFALSLAISFLVPQFAEAANMHFFDCKFCHQTGLTYAQIADQSVCLQCHKNADVMTPLNPSPPVGLDGMTQGRFSVGDASNAFLHNQGQAVNQTSHNWGAPDTQSAAGAVAPNATTYPGFYSRYGGSVGKVTCSRCHDPHGQTTNPKLLPRTANVTNAPPMDVETMCRACHALYASQDTGNHGLYGHPLTNTSDYATVTTSGANAGKYKTAAEVAAATGNSKAELIGGKITCLSCHGMHFTDSDSTTADGVANRTGLQTGDGLMLKGDGKQFVNDPARSTTFCNTCHNYDGGLHGDGTTTMGCMGCHGGHNNAGSTPSYYMLNGNYTSLPTNSLEKSNLWGGTQDGVIDGFCETCHGDIGDAPFNAVRSHNQGEDCTTCHLSHADGAFSQPIGCDGCHGSPPLANAPGNAAAGGYVLNGYAWAPSGSGTASQYSYNTSGHLKDEATTPHTSHSGASSRYSFQCKVCHNTHIDNFAGTHNKDNSSFRDVLEAASPFDPKAQAGAIVPSYNDGHPTGTCNNVYCHSNGGVNDGAGNRTFGFTAAPWAAGGKNSIVGTANECGSCHGNDATDMTAGQKANSAAHVKHLNAGFSCNVCHVNTATGSTALKAGAIGTTHLNKTVDVAFDTTGNLKAGGLPMSNGTTPWGGAANVTCSAVYCHSTGQSAAAIAAGSTRTYKSIQWTSAAALTCTSCHNIGGAGQTPAHAAHVNGSSSDLGRNLDCGVCHDLTMDVGSNGALGTGGLAYHVNGQVDIKMNIFGIDTSTCSNISCHSDGNFEAGATLTYKNVPWTGSPLAGCDDCHGNGSGTSYPIYANGGVGVNSNSHQKHVGGGIVCAECHSQTTATNTAIDGTDKTKHVNRSVEVSGTKITSYTAGTETCSAAACHGAGTPQWGGTVACGSCHAANNSLGQSHAQHYEVATAGDYTLATNSSVAGSYVIQCGVCHSPNGAGAISHAGGWVDSTAPDRRTAQVNFDGTIASGTYTAGATETLDNGFYFTNATCSALYCHGNFGGNGNSATATWGNAASGACGTCHDVDTSATMGGGSHSKHVKVAGFTCDYCHGATAINAAGGIANKALHVDRALNWNFAAAAKPQTAGATYNGTGTGTIAAADVGITGNYAQCSNLYCHSTVQAVPPNGTVGVVYSTPTWGGAAACGTCHKGDAAGVEQDTASHLIHTDADQYGARFSCSACHEAAGSGTALHANYAVDVNINASYDRGGAGAGTYSGTPAPGNAYGSCTNLTCHSNGQGGNPLVNPTWNVALSCAGCHDEAKAGTTLSPAHAAHTFGGATTIGRNLGCQECHADTVSSNTTLNAVTGYAKHVNFVKDLRVLNFGTPQAGCATVYCHSNGNAGNLVYNNPAWSASYGCASCHGNGTVSYPTYANGGTGVNANSHAAHIVGGGYTCNDCHAAVSTAGTAINGTTPTKHIDQAIDVNGAKISSYAAGTCNNVSCHGGNSPVWGASLGCRDCHGNATSDTDDFAYNNGTFAKVALDEWTFSGHGKSAAGTYEVTGRNGAAFDTAAGTGDGCAYCHDGSVSHGTANLFRLRQNGQADLNGACLGCHATGSTGVDPDGAAGVYANKTSSIKVDKYHGGAKHNGTDRDAGRWCWDCHDAHGDADVAGQRIQMVQRRPHQNPDANGVPASLATTDIIFTDRTVGAGAGGFARSAGIFAEGICNSCHTTTAQYTQSLGDNGHPVGQCTVCHKHSDNTTYNGEAFKGSGCSGCHGDAVTDRYWPDGSGVHPDDNAGRHQKHMEVVAAKLGYTLATANDAQQKEMCGYCHAGPGVTNHADGTVNVSSMLKLWDASADNGVFDTAGDGGNGTCATVDCHNNKTTPAGYSWDGATVSACIMCHSDVTAETTHTAHTNAAVTYGRTINCASCHDAATNWSTNTKPASNHINGTFSVSGSVALTYSGTYPTAKGSCGTNVCHNNGRNGAPANYSDGTTYPDYNWGTRVNNGCSFCHQHNTNNHNQHFASGADAGGIFTSSFFTLAGGAGCNACHSHSGNVAAHIDTTITVAAGMNYTGTNLGVTQAASYGTCSTTTCHQNGRGAAVPTPLWNRAPSAADNCSVCHFNAAPAATFSHDTHIGTAAATSYTAAASNNSIAGEHRFNCAKCHGNTLANHLNSASWAAPTVNVDASVAYNAGADTCSNNSCHTNGSGGAANLVANWTSGWVGDLDGDTCNNCHGNSPTSNAHRAHAVGIHAEDIYSGATGKLTTATAAKSHGDATTSTTISCNICHNATVTTARNKFGSECNSCHNGDAAGTVMAVADKSKHVDGTKDVAFADMTAFKSKAQLRDSLVDANDGTNILSDIWNRLTGYKAAATDRDEVKAAFATPNFAAGNCSNVACHNNNVAIWNERGNIDPATYAPNCMACHTSLPK